MRSCAETIRRNEAIKFDDDDIRSAGYEPAAHRRFLLDWFTGRFEGSPARGVPFGVNERTGDARISGSLASLVGLEAAPVDVEVQLGGGLPSFAIVGLADKAVAESRDRIRAAMAAMSLALPAKRITVNLSPADMPGHCHRGANPC